MVFHVGCWGRSPPPLSQCLVIQPVSFCQTDARGPAYAAHDRGVTPRSKGHENRRLPGIRRRKAGVLNLGSVGRGTPVVIGGQSAAVAIMELHRRVLQCPWNRHAIILNRWAKGAEQNPLGSAALENQAVEEDVVIGLDTGPD